MIGAYLHTHVPCVELGIDGQWRNSRPVVIPGWLELLGAMDDLGDDGQPGADPDDAHARQLARFWRFQNVDPHLGDIVQAVTADGMTLALYEVHLVCDDHVVLFLQQPFPETAQHD